MTHQIGMIKQELFTTSPYGTKKSYFQAQELSTTKAGKKTQNIRSKGYHRFLTILGWEKSAEYIKTQRVLRETFLLQ